MQGKRMYKAHLYPLGLYEVTAHCERGFIGVMFKRRKNTVDPWLLSSPLPMAKLKWLLYIVRSWPGKKLTSDGSVIQGFGKLLSVTLSIIYMMLLKVSTVGSGVTDVEGAVQVKEKGSGTGAVAQQGRAKTGLHWEAGKCMSSSLNILTLHMMIFLLESPSTSSGFGMTYWLVYYSALKANFLVIKNMCLVECNIRWSGEVHLC